MSVLAADPLQEKIHGAELGRHEIEVDVERLLEHLCAHHNQPVPLCRRGMLAEALEQQFFPFCAVGHEKLRVKQNNLAVRQGISQDTGKGLRLFHCVEDHAGASAVLKRVLQKRRELALGRDGDLHEFPRTGEGERPLPDRAAICPRQKRIAAVGGNGRLRRHAA